MVGIDTVAKVAGFKQGAGLAKFDEDIPRQNIVLVGGWRESFLQSTPTCIGFSCMRDRSN